jgi:hypothetical protein
VLQLLFTLFSLEEKSKKESISAGAAGREKLQFPETITARSMFSHQYTGLL